jgi:hypothetical protein
MNAWKRAARQALVSGTAASLLSTVVMALAGKAESNAPAGPLNGPSQWLFGRQAAYRRSASLRYTLTGFLIHHAMATGWALLHERLFGRRKRTQTPARRLRNAAVTAAVANFVDYKLTPKRLQPGFEAQLSKKSLFAVYAAFAVGLTAYELARRRRTTRHGDVSQADSRRYGTRE